MFFDFGYIIWVMIPTLLISGAAQLYLRSAYGKWSQTRNAMNMTGAEVGRLIVERTTLGDTPYEPKIAGASGVQANFQTPGNGMRGNAANLRFELTPGHLSDHYDPTSHTVRMSEDVAHGRSVMAMAVVAHELGHAEQHEKNSTLIQMRNLLLPALQFSPIASYILILVGLFLNVMGLFWLGVGLFGLMVVFSILTLPVEIDASQRGLRLLREAGLMQSEQDANGSRQMLTAAAMTYIAAAISSVITLLYYISLATRSND